MYKPVGVSQAEALKEENDSLRCQLDAYRNEVELLKQEQGKNQPMRSEEDSTHSQQLSFLQQALQGMQKVAGTWLRHTRHALNVAYSSLFFKRMHTEPPLIWQSSCITFIFLRNDQLDSSRRWWCVLTCLSWGRVANAGPPRLIEMVIYLCLLENPLLLCCSFLLAWRLMTS